MRADSTLSLLLFAACGGASAAAPSGTASQGDPVAPVWAPLFEAGRTWSFPVAHTHIPAEQGGAPRQTDLGPMRCQVGAVTSRSKARQAPLMCTWVGAVGDDRRLVQPPRGTWIETRDGLWWVAGDAADAARAVASGLPDQERLLAVVPVAHTTPTRGSDHEEHEVWARPGDGGGWCVGHASALGDESGWEMCLGAAGLVGGSWFFAGAEVHTYAFAAR